MDREEIIQLIQETVRQAIETHRHTGNESPKLKGSSLKGAPQDAIVDSAISLTTGGASDLKTSDANAIYSLEDKFNQVLEVLRQIGLMRE